MITLLLIFIFGLPLLNTLLAYTLYCYEQTNAQQLSLGQVLPAVLRTALINYLGECLILFLYPLGFWPRLWTKPQGQGPIVILVHGLFHNPSAWIFFQRWFKKQGYPVACFAYPSWKTNWSSTEDKLVIFLQQILKDHPQQDVHLVGHSLGGLLLRAALGRLEYAPQIRSLSTLGTPYQGSKLAPFALNSLGRYLYYQGTKIQELNARPFPHQIPVLAFKAPVDNMVLPNSALQCPLAHSTTQETGYRSHLTMVYDPQIFKAMLAFIRSQSQDLTNGS